MLILYGVAIVFYAFAAEPPPEISLRFLSQPKTASRTRVNVCCAMRRAFCEPWSITSSTRFWFFSYSARHSRTGVIHLIKLSAIAALHSMQPMPAVRQPSADHFNVSGGENSLCQSYTGHTSGFPGSL